MMIKVSLELDTVYNNKSIEFVECLIHNDKYGFEYLISDTLSAQVHTYPLKLIKNYDQIKWLLIRADSDSNDLFYLKSLSSINGFLCATVNKYAWKKKRRLINLVGLDYLINQDDTLCKWSIRKVNSSTKSDNKYTIWSNYFNESMYASMFAKRFDIHTRYVFLWNDKPDSKQFNWFIDCNKGLFLAS